MRYLLIFFSAQLWAQTTDLNGQITNNNKPEGDLIIKIIQTGQTTVTDQQGQFTFNNLPFGSYDLDIEGVQNKHVNTHIDHQGEALSIDLSQLTLDDLVVTANPLEHNQLRMTTPVTILSEQDLVLDRGLSIDQTLNRITGVNSGSFGVGAGQIVIRGQQGPRVTVLNNNVTNQDAASVSPDHWITTEPLLANQVEVLKGPGTLLYGGSAVGGVVNVVDGVIPTQQINGVTGGIEGRFSDKTLGEQTGVFTINGALSEQWMGHFSYYNSQTDDYEIPGFAESKIYHEAEEADEEHDDDDQHEHNEEREGEAFGLLENSAMESDGFNVGISRVTDRGFWGVSYSDYDRNYGIPGHEHEHGEEDHDHDDSAAKDEDDHDHGEEETVRIDLDKSVFNIKGLHRFDDDNFIRQFRTHYSNTDYMHVELEGDEVGTLFDNQADEFRFEMTHGPVGGFEGIWGLQWTNRDFSALGEEAYILPTETQIWSLFMIEERDFDNWHAEFGLRYDNQTIESNFFPNFDDDALSVSLGATFKLNENWTLPINLTSASRMATAEELFSNQPLGEELVPHLATGTIEIGNLNLTHEVSNNFDIGLKYRNNGWRFNAAFFYNQLDDFIFLRNSGLEEDETAIFVYAQQNTTFVGYEADLAYQFEDGFNNQWDIRLFTDAVKAELNTGENVPRIPSNRYGAEINWTHGPWGIGINHTHVTDQNDVADFELPTKGYDLLDLNVSWVHYHDRFETLVFLRADNLLDEEIREHSSFIKDIAPRPGRSISAGLRVTF